jgi:microcompartment protein CcmL/EutN
MTRAFASSKWNPSAQVSGPFLSRTTEGVTVAGPALGLIEVTSIARGFVIADAMVKRAPVELLVKRPVSPGKYLVLVAGEVADVEEAMQAGIEVSAQTLIDRLLLAQVAEDLLQALRGETTMPTEGALGIFESHSVASALLGADAACKAAVVKLSELRLADGLGGKAYFVLHGDQGDVEAGLEAAERAIPTALFFGKELIARPHKDFLARL